MGHELAKVFDTGCSREAIMALQASMSDHDGKIENPPVKHYFAPGLYAREMFIPAGTMIVGKIHKHAHLNNISLGRILVTTEFGRDEFIAPHQFVSIPGTKRAVLALEDTIWTTYHPTNETDLEKIEEEVIARSYDELPNPEEFEVLP